MYREPQKEKSKQEMRNKKGERKEKEIWINKGGNEK